MQRRSPGCRQQNVRTVCCVLCAVSPVNPYCRSPKVSSPMCRAIGEKWKRQVFHAYFRRKVRLATPQVETIRPPA